MKRLCLCVVISLAALVLVSACSGSAPAPSTPPATSPAEPTSPAPKPPSSQPPISPPGGVTFGQLADAGKTVYTASCAKCHGDRGQGVTAPAVIGTGAGLQKYNTAQGLLQFISAAMPMDAPGSLSQQQYSQVLGYLLVQNNFTPPDALFNASNLSNLTLK